MNGDRAGDPNVAIVITDGRSNIDQQRTLPAAENARRAGIEIYAVGECGRAEGWAGGGVGGQAEGCSGREAGGGVRWDMTGRGSGDGCKVCCGLGWQCSDG